MWCPCHHVSHPQYPVEYPRTLCSTSSTLWSTATTLCSIQDLYSLAHRCVDFREFCQLMIRSQKPMAKDPMQEMREGFQAFDKDGSGTVSIHGTPHHHRHHQVPQVPMPQGEGA